MTRAEQKRIRDTAKYINQLVEKAQEHLPKAEKQRRHDAFMAATAHYRAAYEARLKRDRKRRNRAAGQGS